MTKERTAQLAYSEHETRMLDEAKRRAKATKIIRVVSHFVGSEDWSGLVVADVGCSGGIISAELARTGAHVVGLDIDSPGLGKAQDRVQAAGGAGPTFVCADSMVAPLADSSVDVVVCNHIYEHVVSPERLFADIRRVLRPEGILYLGLGNRWGVIEPHYRLPFLSYLPQAAADRYVRASGRADDYYEQFRTRSQLVRMLADFELWDYTHSALAEPDHFAMGRAWPDRLSGLVAGLSRVARPIVPTFLWVGTGGGRRPAGRQLRRAPTRIAG